MELHLNILSLLIKANTKNVLDSFGICLIACSLATNLFWLSSVSEAVEKPSSVVPLEQEHPYLFVKRSDIPTIMARVERHDWARKAYDDILANAEKLLEDDLTPPPSTGRHSMVYMCPDCGGLLKTVSPTQHQCRDCEKIHSGMPFDAVLYKSQHGKLEKAAMTLGLASLFTDKDVYAQKALEILVKYADIYDTYPMINPRGQAHSNGARIYDQTLNEAIWLVSMSWAYDLILGANVGTEAERKHVEENLIRPSVQTIRKYKTNLISNWQTWHNAGMLAAGLCLRDQEIIDHALLADGGYFYQLEHSIKEEGMQYEGSWSYHFYALHAFLKTAEIGHQSGLNMYGHEPLRRALLLPLQMAMPNGKLPAIHDGTEWAPSTTYYEYAAARYDDPAFEDFLAQHKRAGWEALLMGIVDPEPHPTRLQSVVLQDSGLAVLRQGGSYLLLDFGEHGGGHGHYDKLNIVYFAQGEVVASDPGRFWPYAHRFQREYYKRTLAHNTVAVDGLNQAEATGRIVEHHFGDKYDLIVAQCDTAYPGVEMTRTVAMGADWLVDRFDVKSATPHTYEWIWHVRGQETLPKAAVETTIEGEDTAYHYLEDVSSFETKKSWEMTWILGQDGNRPKFYGLFPTHQPEEIFFATAPDLCGRGTRNALIRRRNATETTFVAVFGDSPRTLRKVPRDIRRRLLNRS